MINTSRFFTGHGWKDKVPQPALVESICVDNNDAAVYVSECAAGKLTVTVRDAFNEILFQGDFPLPAASHDRPEDF